MPGFLVISLLLLLSPLELTAQVHPGMRLRLHSHTLDSTVTGTLVATSADTLFLRVDGMLRQVPGRSIDRLEISRGMGHQGMRTAKTGAAIGGILLGAVAMFTFEKCGERDEFCLFNSGGAQFLGGLAVGSLLGAGVGYVVGLTKRGERWESTALVLAMTPTRVQFSLRF